MESTERLISSDDHVDISHDQVKSFLASRYHAEYDRAVGRFQASMKQMRSGQANQRWREQQMGEPPELPGSRSDDAPTAASVRNAQFNRPGHTDPHARLEDMDIDGVDASSTYCEVSAFRYLYLLEEGAPEATRAFNTSLSEFASVDPRRLVVSYQIPIHDIDAAVREVQWVAAEGGKSLQLPLFPAELGLPDYWESRYDPLWAAITETGLPVCCHIGLNTSLEGLAGRDPTPQGGIYVPMVGLSTGEALGMFIMGGVFERFPELKVVFVEPGLGWVTWWLYIADDMKKRQGYEFPAISELPSHYFHRNVYLTFIDEPDALENARKNLGVANVMWSSDYPHPVTSWPNSKKLIEEMFADATPRERELVLSGNAARVWNM